MAKFKCRSRIEFIVLNKELEISKLLLYLNLKISTNTNQRVGKFDL